MKKEKQSIVSKLRAELKSAQLSATQWQTDYYAKCNKLDEIKDNDRREMMEKLAFSEAKIGEYSGEVKRLTEIIRWLIKPSTAEMEKQAEIEFLKERKRF